jgi:folate-binding protein YgfZ
MDQTREDVASAYTAVREGGAGLIDLSARGRLLVSGSEAVPFLNGLITNDMKTLAENRWMPAVFPNVQGRLLASVRIAHLPDGFLIDTEPATSEVVFKTLERFTFAGDFRVTDLKHTTALLSVQGPTAAPVVQSVLGDVGPIEKNGAATLQWHDEPLTIIRATHTGEDGFDLFVGAHAAPTFRDALTEAGAHPFSTDALEILRIEAGLPRYGIDMDDTNVVSETNLDDAVSYTKGCYIGQEIIARIKYRGHVAKKLTGLIFDQETPIEYGGTIQSVEGKDIGRVTSATFSPRVGMTIALGYLRYDYLAAGTEVKLVSNEAEHVAHVVDLPFVRGSWYQTKSGEAQPAPLGATSL